MKMHDLSPAVGAKKANKRLGRGIGSGTGKTSGKGHKGQWARSGGGVRPGFEGGQMPLSRRLPKTGFDNRYKKVYSIVNLETLIKNGIVGKEEPYGLKVLANGELTKKITVQAKKFSKSAIEKIEKAGGKVEVL